MDKSPSPRKMDPKPATQSNGQLLTVPAHRRTQSGRSTVSGQTSLSQSKSRASTRQSGLTNISNWTAASNFSTSSVKSSFYPSSGFPATKSLSRSGYPNSGYPVSGIPDSSLPGLNYGYPSGNFPGYPAHNYPGFPNFPCCDMPGVTGLQPFYPGSEFPSSAFPGEILQEEDDSQPFIGMYSGIGVEPHDTDDVVGDEYGGGYPTGGFPYMSNMDVTNGYYAYGAQQPYPPRQ